MSNIPLPGQVVANPDINYGLADIGGVEYEIFNGRPDAYKFALWSKDYRVPATDEHWVGKNPYTRESIVYPKPGVMPVWNIPGQGANSAKAMIDFVLGKDRRSGHGAVSGLRILMGRSKKEDEAIMQEAREQARVAIEQSNDEKIRAWEQHVMKCNQTKEPTGPMPTPVRQAYRLRKTLFQKSEDRFRCEICTEGFPSRGDMMVHIVEDHEMDHPEAGAKARAWIDAQEALARPQERLVRVAPKPEEDEDLDFEDPDTALDPNAQQPNLGDVRPPAPDKNTAELEAKLKDDAKKKTK
jgi:hypothetical protein